MSNIVLIGFMGAGKSAVGRGLARALGLSFFDTDRFIEEKAGRTIADIWEKEGELPFRLLEREAVQAAVSQDRRVISTGGGAFLDLENRRRLATYGTVVWLKASPEAILRRVQRTPGKRPILKDPDPVAVIKALLEKRTPCYQEAAFSVDTSDAGVSDVVVQIKDRILKIEADSDSG